MYIISLPSGLSMSGSSFVLSKSIDFSSTPLTAFSSIVAIGANSNFSLSWNTPPLVDWVLSTRYYTYNMQGLQWVKFHLHTSVSLLE